jgi:hypothetical protein
MKNDSTTARRRQVNENGWPALTGCDPRAAMRGSNGIGLHVARWAAEQGYAVVAMVPLAVTGGEKIPMEKWGKLGYRTPEQIRASTVFRRRCGVAIITDVSGLFVADLDSEDGEAWLGELADGRDISTRILQTHKGRHLIFDDGGIAYKNTSGELASGVDTRGHRGLELIYDPGQPERHFTDLREPADLPDWLAAVLPLAGSRSRRANGHGGDLDVRRLIREGIPPGQHDARMRDLALSQARQGVFAQDGSDEQLWLDFASGILAQSDEGTDANGNVREKFTADRIIGWYTSACHVIGRDKDPSNLIESFADVQRKKIEWIIPGWLARGDLTVLDGEKASAKSFLWIELTALLSRGETVPWANSTGEVFSTIVFGSESSAETETGPRLDAAGADVSRIFRHVVKRRIVRREDADKRAKLLINGKWVEPADNEYIHAADRDVYLEWTLPEHTDQFVNAIKAAGASIAVFDPINSFFSEKTNTGSDVQIRRALAPILARLRELGCAAIFIRHMNQDIKVSAKFRGLGSSAYQNLSRVHLAVAELDEGLAIDGDFGIAMLASNARRRKRGIQTYSVVDSDIEVDDDGGMVGRLVWNKFYGDISADDMLKKARGPEPYALRDLLHLLRPMFDEKDTWPAREVEEAIEDAGLMPNSTLLGKAKKQLGIVSRQQKGGGWVWTNAPSKFHIKRSGG